MRIGYFGSPPISARLLERLWAGDHGHIVFVLSNPDKRQKRSDRPIPTAVSALVRERERGSKDGKKNAQSPALILPENLGDPHLTAQLKGFQADLFIVFAYGKILPPQILELPSLGAINLHASLLPQLRGAAPIQSAILQGLAKTGWTVQFIHQKLDVGDIILQKEIAIQAQESAGELKERMLPEGIALVLESLEQLERGTVQAQPQEDTKASYCTKIHKSDAQILWEASAQEIHNRIRAYNPKPVAWTLLGQKHLHLYRTALMPKTKALPAPWALAPPGSFGVSTEGGRKELWVKAQDGVLSILELQLENRRRMQAHEFINGYRHEGEQILGGKV